MHVREEGYDITVVIPLQIGACKALLSYVTFVFLRFGWARKNMTMLKISAQGMGCPGIYILVGKLDQAGWRSTPGCCLSGIWLPEEWCGFSVLWQLSGYSGLGSGGRVYGLSGWLLVAFIDVKFACFKTCRSFLCPGRWGHGLSWLIPPLAYRLIQHKPECDRTPLGFLGYTGWQAGESPAP